MNEYIEIDNCKYQYIAFVAKENKCAVPIEYVMGIAQLDKDTLYAIPPNASKYVNFIAMLGNEVITVIEFPKDSERNNSMENLIIILNHENKKIGMLAHNAHLITVSKNEMSENEIVGEKSIMYKNTPYLLIDVQNLYEYIGA